MKPTATGKAKATKAQRQSPLLRMANYHYMPVAELLWPFQNLFGGMGERPKPPVLKTGEAKSLRGFESPSLRQLAVLHHIRQGAAGPAGGAFRGLPHRDQGHRPKTAG